VIRLRDLAMYECTAYIPDMLCQDTKRARQRQARYEARRRVGVALYPANLGGVEIDALHHGSYRTTTRTPTWICDG
jgi:hypothetical protein